MLKGNLWHKCEVPALSLLIFILGPGIITVTIVTVAVGNKGGREGICLCMITCGFNQCAISTSSFQELESMASTLCTFQPSSKPAELHIY